jgi:RNA polymerase sigma-70 factor (ECF subfamily)
MSGIRLFERRDDPIPRFGRKSSMQGLVMTRRASASPGQLRGLRAAVMTDLVDDAHQAEPAALIHAIATRGDRMAFAALFNRFAPRVKAYLMKLGMDAAGAEDLAQDVLLTVWRKAGQFDPARASAATWIFIIARNLRIDTARRARRATPLSDPVDEPQPVPIADALLAAEDRDNRIRAAMATLPAEQADVIRMSFFDDRPHAEIERALGIPLGTVKSRLRLALSRLRRLLDDES